MIGPQPVKLAHQGVFGLRGREGRGGEILTLSCLFTIEGKERQQVFNHFWFHVVLIVGFPPKPLNLEGVK